MRQRGGSRTYSLRVKARIPSGQSRTGSASAYAYGFSGPDCTGSSGATYAASDVKTPDSWTERSSPVAHPSGVVSLKILLRVEKTEAGGAFRAHFDDVLLSEMEALTVPATASIHGNAGASFHSDLWVMNRSYTTTKIVTLRYR